MNEGKKFDFGGHMEYHTTSPKKAKAADCVYLDRERKCGNKKSDVYLEKCFRATWCPFRLKEGEKEKQKIAPVKIKKMVAIPCSLPTGTKVFNSAGREGTIVGYEPNSRALIVRFYNEHKYLYPSCFDDGYLSVEDGLQKYIVMDKEKAVWK